MFQIKRGHLITVFFIFVVWFGLSAIIIFRLTPEPISIHTSRQYYPSKFDILHDNLSARCALFTSFSTNQHRQKCQIIEMWNIFGVRPLRNNSVSPLRLLNYDLGSDLSKWPLVSVVLVSHNTKHLVLPSLLSLFEQSYPRLEIIVVDDCSTDGTTAMLYPFSIYPARKIQGRERSIRIFKNLQCRGAYFCRNLGLSMATGDYLTFQDSDDVSHIDRISVQVFAHVRFVSENPLMVGSTVNYVRVSRNKFDRIVLVRNRGALARRSMISMLFNRSKVLSTVGYFDNVRVGGDEEYFSRIRDTYGLLHTGITMYFAMFRSGSDSTSSNVVNIFNSGKKKNFLSTSRQDYANSFMAWHKSSSLPLYVSFPMRSRPFAAPKMLTEGTLPLAHVSMSVTSHDTRIDTLRQMIASVIDQVDALFVYLNNYDTIPAFLQHSKISVVLASKAMDIKDNGKVYFLSSINEGYHFMCDDDIIYPPDYIQKMILKIELYYRKIVIGVHGVNTLPNFNRYYGDREVFHGKRALKTDRFVELLGTGTVAYHTSLLPDLDISDFPVAGMLDIWFAVYCAKHQIPRVAIARDDNWLIFLESGKQKFSLWENMKKNDTLHSSLVKQYVIPQDDPLIDLREKLCCIYSDDDLKSRDIDVNGLNCLCPTE